MNIIKLNEATSTNTVLASMAADAPHGTIVYAVSQTAGRGQRGNSWESEPGKNITMSVLLKPASVAAAQQFAISEAVSLAIVTVLRRHINGHRITVKWPNDIYAGDRKICGILVENTLTGSRICHSIAGIGININQREFRSDAPNPVSIFQLTGRETPVEEIMREFCEEILAAFARIDREGETMGLHGEYSAALWRADGFYPYTEASTGKVFKGRIAGIAPTGHITLERQDDGRLLTYAFKEISAVL